MGNIREKEEQTVGLCIFHGVNARSNLIQRFRFVDMNLARFYTDV